MNRKLYYFAGFVLALLLQVSCSKTDLDPNDPPNTSDANFRCKIDGDLFAPNSLLVSGLKTETGDFYSLSASGTVIEGGDTITVVVTVSGMDFNDVDAGVTFEGTGTVLDMTAIGNLVVNDTDAVDATSLETSDATITITAIDKVEEVFSGSFSFVAVDPAISETFTITEGEFQNVEYR